MLKVRFKQESEVEEFRSRRRIRKNDNYFPVTIVIRFLFFFWAGGEAILSQNCSSGGLYGYHDSSYFLLILYIFFLWACGG